ncbi:hypothetical protein KFL_000180450 [Klebsormidium nitens]|uniref:MYND-type domain-containing protein n=1 Tax=Klebsormidium nitens TaxID=105231 RepID=A0A1Y1HM51_KLENI|nr:hypothetical protein KFL_000180450 [Klebsormidium nitens]|eukprot:GAQ78762.1 hypothetical protein KFL_000180450 [Klebsormidium nitens]
MVALGCRVEKDKALMKAHALAKFNSARPILAAGLYSVCQDFQAQVAGCLYAYVNDGDLRRGFPAYWEPFERFIELLDSDSWEVVGQAALGIAALCHAPFACPGSPQLFHQLEFFKLGAVDKMIALISDPQTKRWSRSYTREDAQMELAYALTPFLENSDNLIGPEAPQKVLGAPGLIPRLVELASCSEREGEVQRVALQCLVLTAELSPQVAEVVLRAGAKKVAEKALKQPFAGPKNDGDQQSKQRAATLLRILKDVEIAAPEEQAPSSSTPSRRAQGLPSLEDIDRLSVKELKGLLQQHGVGCQECLEKADLKRKVRALVGKSAAQPSPETRPPAARSSGEGRFTFQEAAASSTSSSSAAAPVASTTPEGSAGKTRLPSLWSVSGLSIKDLHEKLKALNVSTAGCVERQDLVDRLTSELERRAADPDFFPSLDQGLGPPAQPSEDVATISAFMSVLGTPAHRQARRTANQMLQKLLQKGDLPKDTTLEGAAQLMMRGGSSNARLSGLRVVKAAIDELPSHQARRDAAAAGMLKATVRLLQEVHRELRVEVLEVLSMFTRSPSLSAQVWNFGAMEAVLEELRRPVVLEAIAAQSPDVVGKSADLSAPVRACLCLFADMMWPARVEDQLVGNTGMPFNSLNELTDAFTRKLNRWLAKHGVYDTIGKLLTIARLKSWNATWQGCEANSVVHHGMRLFLQVLMTTDQQDKILSMPGMAENLVYLIEQWETSEPECTLACSFLVQVRNLQDGLTTFCTRDEIFRVVRALKDSTRRREKSRYTEAHSSLADALVDDLKKERYPPPIGPARFWCNRLKEAPDTDAAERIVKNLLGFSETLPPMANDQQLYELEFWPALARQVVRASPNRRFLLITFAEAFNLYPESKGIPLEPGVKRIWNIVEPHRSNVTLQLLRAGIVRTLEPVCHVDETAAHVMHFFQYLPQDAKVGGPIAKALLTDPDLMPFLLRFALLEEGCALGVALAKLAVKALLSVSPSEGSGSTVPDNRFSLTIRSEVDPERPEDSLRYDYQSGNIFVGTAHVRRVSASVADFMSNGHEIITEYNQAHPDRPYHWKYFEKSEPRVTKYCHTPPQRKPRECAMCAKSPAKSKCARCQKTVYCSKDCQLADWPSHKLKCQRKSS